MNIFPWLVDILSSPRLDYSNIFPSLEKSVFETDKKGLSVCLTNPRAAFMNMFQMDDINSESESGVM